MLSIANVSVIEGKMGSRLATFAISLSQPGSSAVTYNTAMAGSDYLARSLTAQSIPAASTSATFAVTLLGDTFIEPNETYLVRINGVLGAMVANDTAIGTFVNDDSSYPG